MERCWVEISSSSARVGLFVLLDLSKDTQTRWRLGKKRMLLFLLIMSLVFFYESDDFVASPLARNGNLRRRRNAIGHDGYESWESFTTSNDRWLNGTPWYFYLVFVAVSFQFYRGHFVIGLP